MPAYFDTGFSVRTPMWHRMGNVIEDYPTDWDDARKKAGLLWEPTYADLFVQQVVPTLCRHCAEAMGFDSRHTDTCPLFDTDDTKFMPHAVRDTDCGPDGSVPIRHLDNDRLLVHVPAAGHQAIVRDDTWGMLATPTDTFKLIYHSQMGELLEAYTAAWRKAGAEVKFETAGSVRGGAMVWALVWLDEPMYVPGDDSPTYRSARLARVRSLAASGTGMNSSRKVRTTASLMLMPARSVASSSHSLAIHAHSLLQTLAANTAG